MLPPTADPARLGFDPRRLSRIDSHFGRYVDDGLLPGWQIVVTRRGEVVHASTYGQRDREAGLPVAEDTLWRIYSMTKPLTSVAAMALWEEGRFELTDELSRFIPAFEGVRVYDKGSALRPFTVPATEPIRLWHLLTHTSGLTYGFMQTSVVDALYRKAGFDLGPSEELDLATLCERYAALPLLFQPGSAWGYSVATDVLGRVIEVVTGQSLDAVFEERILRPLAMTDTRWWVDPEAAGRLAALYAAREPALGPDRQGGAYREPALGPDRQGGAYREPALGPDRQGGAYRPGGGAAVRYDALGRYALRAPAAFAGGSGLVSSAADYHRFTQMLLRGGELDGQRILGNRTLRYMTRNHLPGGRDLGALSTGGFAETTQEGIGFGLGFAVVGDPVPGRTLASPGEYYWGGMASTLFWVDPAEELTAMLFTQVVPSGTHPLRPQLHQLVYSALVD
ncbi:serine hydrolase domain-containing protein [Rugosimonospora acidiphila]|uniref:Serine hydrolase domain-containing protein n=1 Tax=Rugosimonospora acidiphila TaxID=556531 RepID=A0ABP9SJ99_9ACTN